MIFTATEKLWLCWGILSLVGLAYFDLFIAFCLTCLLLGCSVWVILCVWDRSYTRIWVYFEIGGWYSQGSFEGVNPEKANLRIYPLGVGFLGIIVVDRANRANTIFPTQAHNTENRRTLNPSWPFRNVVRWLSRCKPEVIDTRYYTRTRFS